MPFPFLGGLIRYGVEAPPDAFGRRLRYNGLESLTVDALISVMRNVAPRQCASIDPRAVRLNGGTITTRARTLAELLAERGPTGARVATALNGRFVPERERAATPVGPGDAIEIVSARQGG